MRRLPDRRSEIAGGRQLASAEREVVGHDSGRRRTLLQAERPAHFMLDNRQEIHLAVGRAARRRRELAAGVSAELAARGRRRIDEPAKPGPVLIKPDTVRARHADEVTGQVGDVDLNVPQDVDLLRTDPGGDPVMDGLLDDRSKLVLREGGCRDVAEDRRSLDLGAVELVQNNVAAG